MHKYKNFKKMVAMAIFATLFATPLLSQKTTPEAYINKYNAIAINEMLRSGIPASITLAQGILESGNGNSSLATEGNNHFGIKCHKEWTGKTMHLDDDAPDECFRKYENPEESYIDHTDFLRGRERYAFLFELETTDYKGWAHGLKKAGYATNPHYAQKLIELIERYNLQRFDENIDMNSLETSTSTTKRASRKKPTDDFIIDLNTKHQINYNNGIKYIEVKPGDTFESICDEFGMKKWEIYHYNDLPTGSNIKYHKYLYIQNKRNKAHASHNTHTMRENETLFAVAHKFGVKLKKLQKYNLLKKGEEPKTGQLLQLRQAVKTK